MGEVAAVLGLIATLQQIAARAQAEGRAHLLDEERAALAQSIAPLQAATAAGLQAWHGQAPHP